MFKICSTILEQNRELSVLIQNMYCCNVASENVYRCYIKSWIPILVP